MGLKFWLVAVLLLVAAVECQASPLLEHDYEVDNDRKELFDDSKEIGEPEDIIDKEDYEADNVNEPKALALFDDSEEDDYEADNEAKAMFGDSEEDGEPEDIVDEDISDVVVSETDEPVDQTDEESDDTVGDLNMQDPRRRRRSRRPRGRRQRGRRRRRQRGRQRRRGRGRGGRGRRRRRSRRRRRPTRNRKGGRRRRLRSGGRRRRNKSRSRRRCFAQICSSHTRNRIRGSDAHGSGAWGAPRGSRTHRGIDVICNAGSSVNAPFSAKVIRESRPYGNGKPHDTGIYMEGTGDWTGYAVMMFYVTKGIGNGASVSARGRIGSMTNMAAQYSRGMTNHIHVQLYRNGGIVNPTPYLNC